MVMGNDPRSVLTGLLLNESEHPAIIFVCREDKTGGIMVEDDLGEGKSPAWDHYFS